MDCLSLSLFLECLIIEYLPYLLPRYILVFVFFFFWFGLIWFVVCCSLLFARIASASDVMPRERFVDRSIWLVSWLLVLLLL